MFRCETFIDDIISDCETLELLPENSVIIHPFIDTDDIIIDGQTLRFPLPNLNRKKTLKLIAGRQIYKRIEERPHHNFITTSSVLYKFSFFSKHFLKLVKAVPTYMD